MVVTIIITKDTRFTLSEGRDNWINNHSIINRVHFSVNPNLRRFWKQFLPHMSMENNILTLANIYYLRWKTHNFV